MSIALVWYLIKVLKNELNLTIKEKIDIKVAKLDNNYFLDKKLNEIDPNLPEIVKPL
jgi:hypothetical protein